MIWDSKDSADGFKNKAPKQGRGKFSNTASKRRPSKPPERKEPKPPKKISERYLYNSGLAYLQRFPASSSHFKSIMMRKIYKSCQHHEDQNAEECEDLLDSLVIQFQDLKLLDDTSYLKGMIISLRKRGLSALQITMRLQQKGFEKDAIKSALKTHDDLEYETDDNDDVNGDIYAALIFARKKRLGPYDPEQKRSPEKSLASMARAGYSYDIAKKTLEITPEELEEKLMTLSSL